jgi:hypothetical protein
MAIVGIVCGLYTLVHPRWLLDFIWDGQAAPSAYAAFIYTDTFLESQALWLFALLLLNIPMLVGVIVQGRWSPLMRRVQTTLGLVTCAVMVWTITDGPVFVATVSDQTAKFLLALLVVFMLADLGITRYRRVRPTPGTLIRT